MLPDYQGIVAKVLGDKQAEVDGGVDVQEIIEVVAGRVLEAIDDQGVKEHKSHREVRSIVSNKEWVISLAPLGLNVGVIGKAEFRLG